MGSPAFFETFQEVPGDVPGDSSTWSSGFGLGAPRSFRGRPKKCPGNNPRSISTWSSGFGCEVWPWGPPLFSKRPGRCPVWPWGPPLLSRASQKWLGNNPRSISTWSSGFGCEVWPWGPPLFSKRPRRGPGDVGTVWDTFGLLRREGAFGVISGGGPNTRQFVSNRYRSGYVWASEAGGCFGSHFGGEPKHTSNHVRTVPFGTRLGF